MVLSIRAVDRGEAIFSPAIATRVLAYFAASPQDGAPPQAFPTLTDREREILSLLARMRTRAGGQPKGSSQSDGATN